MEDESDLTDYEKARRVIIARNQARLQALGIATTVKELQEAAGKEQKAGKAPKAEKKRGREEADAPREPARRSRRLNKTEEEDVKDENDEAAAELATFIIDGECPKCGKVVTRGHKKHLAICTGKAAYEPTLAEMIAIETKRVVTQEEKLKQLDIGGLIELNDEHVVFVVLGSTGKHYKVDISDEKRKCQCVDHRCRRHDCKHIRLMLKTLNVEKDPSTWREGARKLVESQGQEIMQSIKAKAAKDNKAAAPNATQQAGQAFLD